MPKKNGGGVKGATNQDTGNKAGKGNSKTSRDGSTSKDSKSAAGSALSQKSDKKK